MKCYANSYKFYFNSFSSERVKGKGLKLCLICFCANDFLNFFSLSFLKAHPIKNFLYFSNGGQVQITTEQDDTDVL